MTTAALFAGFLSCALFATTLAADPEIQCVVDANGDNAFSVWFEDAGSITDSQTITVKYKATATSTELDTTCVAANVEKKYFEEADITGLTPADKKFTHATSTGSTSSHKYTRFMIKLNPCSLHTTVDVAATTTEAAKKKQIFEAQLQMGPTALITDSAYDLKCLFYQSTLDQTLTVTSELGQVLQADEQRVEAELKLFKLVTGTTGTTETPVATTDKVKLGETLLLKANIKGNINVETAFKYCKICAKSDCSGTSKIDLITQYDGAQTPANEKMNCLNTDIRSNTKFVVTPSSATAKTSTFQFPAFRYSNSEKTAELYLQCSVAICKSEAGVPCRSKCEAAASGNGRRRRSADQIDPLEAHAALAITIMTPMNDSCSTPGPARRAAPRAACTNGDKLGSVCRQACDRGFEGAGGRRSVARLCQEQITEKIGAIYFGTAPKWTPEEARCEDINECLTNPCPDNSICENTVGSFRCM